MEQKRQLVLLVKDEQAAFGRTLSDSLRASSHAAEVEDPVTNRYSMSKKSPIFHLWTKKKIYKNNA